jgi:hypothetical protein
LEEPESDEGALVSFQFFVGLTGGVLEEELLCHLSPGKARPSLPCSRGDLRFAIRLVARFRDVDV